MRIRILMFGLIFLLFGGVSADHITTPPVKTITAFVARKDLFIGQYLKDPEELFRPVLIAKNAAPKDSIKNLAQLKDKTMTRSLTNGSQKGHRYLFQLPLFAVRTQSDLTSLPHELVRRPRAL
jgi:hypothetical protein